MSPWTKQQAPKPHPDWFWLLSGGLDSTAAYLLSRDALHDNYGKRPLAIYLDTRIGIPLQLLYVQELCDRYDEQLWTLRTHESFERRVAGEGRFADNDAAGNPGPAQHTDVQNELKRRQWDKLTTLASHPVYVTGIRAAESAARAAEPKGEYDPDDDAWYVKPVYELTKDECAEIVLAHPECPINPLWLLPHFGDCACGSLADPQELVDARANGFEWFVRRIREIEESAAFDDRTATWGWGGLSEDEQQWLDAFEDDAQLSLCGPSCGRKAAILYGDGEDDEEVGLSPGVRERLEARAAEQARRAEA